MYVFCDKHVEVGGHTQLRSLSSNMFVHMFVLAGLCVSRDSCLCLSAPCRSTGIVETPHCTGHYVGCTDVSSGPHTLLCPLSHFLDLHLPLRCHTDSPGFSNFLMTKFSSPFLFFFLFSKCQLQLFTPYHLLLKYDS